MRQISQLLFLSLILSLFSTTSLLAQSTSKLHGISAKRLFIDYYTTINGKLAEPKTYSGGWELAYSRNLGKNLNIIIPLQIGVANLPNEINNRKLFGLDALLQYQFFKEDSFIVPYAMGGLGIRSLDNEDISFQVPIGLGLNFKLGPWAYLSAHAQYRLSPTDNRSNLQYGLGFQFMFNKIEKKPKPIPENKQDADGDGIPNDKDKCPDLAGVALFGGCPDTDNDGLPDDKDKCPKEKGVIENDGCPLLDTDNDGIVDRDDDCPKIAGTVQFNGCPDTDGDGVADKDDDCPKVAGDISNNGCPITDSDGDGVPDSEDDCPNQSGKLNGCPDKDNDGVADKDDVCPTVAGEKAFSGCPDSDKDGVADGVDKCPTIAGTISNKGCPELSQEERNVLSFAMQAVQFETGSAQLRSSSFAVLSQIYDILLKYPNYNLSISGHTDNVGNADNNLRLSEQRAESCMNYLVSKGIRPERISYIGYGELRPIADNDTKAGRELNRRVEFDLFVK